MIADAEIWQCLPAVTAALRIAPEHGVTGRALRRCVLWAALALALALGAIVGGLIVALLAVVV